MTLDEIISRCEELRQAFSGDTEVIRPGGQPVKYVDVFAGTKIIDDPTETILQVPKVIIR